MSAQLRALRAASLPLEQTKQRVWEIYDRMYQTDETFMNWAEARMLTTRDVKPGVQKLRVEREHFVSRFNSGVTTLSVMMKQYTMAHQNG